MQLEKNVEALLSALESGMLPQDFPNIMISPLLLLSLLLACSLPLRTLTPHDQAIVLKMTGVQESRHCRICPQMITTRQSQRQSWKATLVYGDGVLLTRLLCVAWIEPKVCHASAPRIYAALLWSAHARVSTDAICYHALTKFRYAMNCGISTLVA